MKYAKYLLLIALLAVGSFFVTAKLAKAGDCLPASTGVTYPCPDEGGSGTEDNDIIGEMMDWLSWYLGYTS